MMLCSRHNAPGWFDLHTHSVRSDGTETPEELVKAAKEAGLGTLAITDHNCFDAALAAELSRAFGIEVIPASEFSALYTSANGVPREIHIIGLWLEETPEIQTLLQRNQLDRKPYVMAYLRELERLGIDLSPDGSRDPERAFRQLERENQGTAYLGRAAIANRMAAMGYVGSVDEAFAEWIGRAPEDHPRVRVCPEEFMRYASPEEVVSAIHSCPGGLAVLCHPFYPTPAEEVEELAACFALQWKGDAIEVYYGTGEKAYSPAQKTMLLELARRYGLTASGGSDRHTPDRPFLRGRPEVFQQLARSHDRLLRAKR